MGGLVDRERDIGEVVVEGFGAVGESGPVACGVSAEAVQGLDE